MDSIHFILKMKNKTLVLVLFFQKKPCFFGLGVFDFVENQADVNPFFFKTTIFFEKKQKKLVGAFPYPQKSIFQYREKQLVFFSEINKKQFQKKENLLFLKAVILFFMLFFLFKIK